MINRLLRSRLRGRGRLIYWLLRCRGRLINRLLRSRLWGRGRLKGRGRLINRLLRSRGRLIRRLLRWCWHKCHHRCRSLVESWLRRNKIGLSRCW